MSDLIKATLQELGDPPKPLIKVQFNPASLRLALSNVVEGGRAQGRQVRQFLGRSSTEVSFELVFDTADDGRNVRERTALVEKFLVPKRTGAGKATPPKVRFQWASYVIEGVISSLTIDIDLFAANGTPLRAKMGVSIKEQDPKYQYLQAGPGANRPDGAVAPGARGDARPGTSGDYLVQTEASPRGSAHRTAATPRSP